MSKKHLLLMGALACMLAASIALVGCSSNSSKPADEPSTDSTPVGTAPADTEAVVNPEEIDPGSLLESNDISKASDIWYIDGDSSKGGLYFNTTSGKWGVLAVNTFTPDGKVSTSATNGAKVVNEVKDNHLVSTEGVTPAYDFNFADPFRCYDNTTGTLYVRGDKPYLEAVQQFVKSSPVAWEKSTFTFKNDGTLEMKDSDGKTHEGTWTLVTPNLFNVTIDGSNQPQFEAVFDNGGKITEVRYLHKRPR